MSEQGASRIQLLHILVVEDSTIQAFSLKRILEKEGYIVSMARNGVEGLAMARQIMPGLIITDIVMPEMNGFIMCKHIKDSEELRETPVILLTSLNDPKDIIGGLKCGADNFITKPFDEKFLLSRIKYMLLSRELFRNERTQMGIEIYFGGEKHFITSDRQQILNLLLSSYESAVMKNKEMLRANEALQSEIFHRKKIEEELNMLYRISTAISSTLDIKKLFNEIIEVIRDIKLFDIESKTVILAAGEDEDTDDVHRDEFLEFHRNLASNDCMCGLAARMGGIVVSGDAQTDPRHVGNCPVMEPHGHILIPLNASGKLVGILCLNIRADKNLQVDAKTIELLQTIGNQIGIALEHARIFEETKKSAYHDALTGLPNRRLLHIITDKLFASTKRGKTLSVIMFDIDKFKVYNDTYGHPAGDKVLIAVSQSARKHSREMNFIARYGGEEFIILLPETDSHEAMTAANRLREGVEAETDVTISLGISTYSPAVASMEDLIKNADEALYTAKKNGRNRAEMYAPA